jgi:hypothetical protein
MPQPPWQQLSTLARNNKVFCNSLFNFEHFALEKLGEPSGLYPTNQKNSENLSVFCTDFQIPENTN